MIQVGDSCLGLVFLKSSSGIFHAAWQGALWGFDEGQAADRAILDIAAVQRCGK